MSTIFLGRVPNFKQSEARKQYFISSGCKNLGPYPKDIALYFDYCIIQLFCPQRTSALWKKIVIPLTMTIEF